MNEARMPPQAIEEEMAILGSIFIDRKAFYEAQEVLTEECFYKPGHQKIYRAMMNIDSRGDAAIDYLTVSEELEKAGQLEEVGGAYYLTELSNYVPSAVNAKDYVEIVAGKFVLRKVIEIAFEVEQAAFDGNIEPKDVLEMAQAKFLALNMNGKKRIAHWNDILQRSFELIGKFHDQRKPIIGIATGIVDLDEKLGGLKNGDLIVVAGRPGSGKTSFAVNNIALSAAKSGVATAIFSLEMSDESLAMRSISAESMVDHHRMSHGMLKDSEWQQVARKISGIYDIPIFIDDTSGANIVSMRARARQLKVEYNIGLILIDYLQLVTMKGRIESENIKIGQISQNCKNMARELNIPVVLLSQLNRECEKRPSKMPVLSDLRASGDIEQDSDVVIFTFRPEIHGEKPEKYHLKGNSALNIAKHRQGPTGKVQTNYLEKQMIFCNLDTIHEESGGTDSADFLEERKLF